MSGWAEVCQADEVGWGALIEEEQAQAEVGVLPALKTPLLSSSWGDVRSYMQMGVSN